MAELPHRPFLCVITDDDLPADRIVAAVGAACAKARLVVQVRARNRNGRDLFELAERLREVTAARASLLIVNDRIDVALGVNADGVHLPAAGVPPLVARGLLERHAGGAERLLVGVSVHTVGEIHANAAFVDYFQFGPVFATPSKARYGPPQGIAALESAVAASRGAGRPLIAVGGIDATNVLATTTAGAAGVAVIRAIMRATDPGAATLALLEALTRRRA